MRFTLLTMMIVSLSGLAATPAKAEPVAVQPLAAQLTGTTDAVGQAKTIGALLQLTPRPGRHIGWRMPGNEGSAPHFDWSRSQNVSAVVIDWPTPQRFNCGLRQGIGYASPTAFPLRISLRQPGQAMTLTLQVDVLDCAEDCVPEEATVTLSLPAGTGHPTTATDSLAAAKAAVPAKEDRPGLRIETAVFGPDALVVRAFSQGGFAKADLFVEPVGLQLFQPPVVTVDAQDRRHATLRIAKDKAASSLPASAIGQGAALTLVTPSGAVEKDLAF